MRKIGFVLFLCFWLCGFFCGCIFADTIRLINGQEVRGVIIDEVDEKVVINTSDGKKDIARRNIESVDYSEPEQYYFNLGNKLRRESKIEEASVAYQRALAIRPDFGRAKQALFSLRVYRWNEQEETLKKQIELLNNFQKDVEFGSVRDAVVTPIVYDEEKVYRQIGFFLQKQGSVVVVKQVRQGSVADRAGIKESDVIVTLGGMRLDDMDYAVLLRKFIMSLPEIRISIYRKFSVYPVKESNWLSWLPSPSFYWGLGTSLGYEGLTIKKIKQGSAVWSAGLKVNDIIFSINNNPVQFLSPAKVNKLMMMDRKKLDMIVLRYVTFWKDTGSEK